MASPSFGVRFNGSPSLSSPAQAPTASATQHYHPYSKLKQQTPASKGVLFINQQPTPTRVASGSHSALVSVELPLDSPGAQANELHRPKRKKITDNQLEHLTALFAVTDSPSYDQREEVGQRVVPSMSSREVQVWFQNRRAKVNREKAQKSLDLAGSLDDGLAPAVTPKSELANAKSQFRFKPTPNNAHDAQLAPPQQNIKNQQNDAAVSSFRIPNPNQQNGLPPPTVGDRFNRSPVLAQSQAGPHRRAFTGPPIQIPARHAPHSHLVHHHSHSGTTPVNTDSPRSPSAWSSSPSVVGSPFFGVHSPTFAFAHSNSAQNLYQAMPGSGTPGLSSHSSTGSGYFTAAASGGSALSGSEWPPASPYTPGSLYSPSTTNFFKLSLADSPRDTKWEQGAPLGSPGLPLSPPPTAGEPLVRLPPITSSPRRWRSSRATAKDDSPQRGLTHKRSFSDGSSTSAAPINRGHRLPSLRGLFEGLSRKVGNSAHNIHHTSSAQRSSAAATSSAPTSPVDGSISAQQQRNNAHPPLVRSATTPQLSHKAEHESGSASDKMEMDAPSHEPEQQHHLPLGLGMLAVAADSLSKMSAADGQHSTTSLTRQGETEEEQNEREKLWRLRATRKLSYDCGLGHPAGPGARRNRSREQHVDSDDSGNSSGMETAR